MMPFTGTPSEDLDSFKKAVKSILEKHKSALINASNDVLKKICDPDLLHVWECDSDMDDLLQLTSVIAKLCDIGARKEMGTNANDGSMVIIAEEKRGRNNFVRIGRLVQHLTGAEGKSLLEGTVVAFGKIVVVRGWDNSIREGQNEAREKAIKRINISIKRALEMGHFANEKKKIVWHHGPVFRFLLNWIEHPDSSLRSKLSAITVTGFLDLNSYVTPSRAGRANTPDDFKQLKDYATRLNIPVVFLDPSAQSITSKDIGAYLYYFSYYINTFLPSSVTQTHLFKAQDELITFAFRIRAASEGIYGSEVVKQVQRHLDANIARKWARGCIDRESYEKAKCKAAGEEVAIHHAVLLAMHPFALFKSGASGLTGLARLAVGPTTPSPAEYSLAVPVDINFKSSKLRPAYPATFHVLISHPSQKDVNVTHRIQGLMMAVLERIRKEKGTPVFGDMEKSMWKAVTKSCLWALDGCEGNCPKKKWEWLTHVRKMLKMGTWGVELLGSPLQEGEKSATAEIDASATMAAALATGDKTRSYGFGQGTQQTMGAFGQATTPQRISVVPQTQGCEYLQQMPFPPQQQQVGLSTQAHNFAYPQQPPLHGQQHIACPAYTQDMGYALNPPPPPQIQPPTPYPHHFPFSNSQQRALAPPLPIQTQTKSQHRHQSTCNTKCGKTRGPALIHGTPSPRFAPGQSAGGGYAQSMGGPW